MNLHDALDELATDVRPVDLAPRVAHGVRRRRQRRLAVATGSAFALVLGAVLVVPRVTLPTRPTSPPGKAYDLVWVDDQVTPRENTVLAAVAGDPAATTQAVGDVRDVDLSPDGRKLALVFDDHVAVAALDGDPDDRRRLDVPLSGGDRRAEVSWAPDSRRLAVVEPSDRGQPADGFWIADSVTGDARHVAYPHLGQFASWSPDGTRIAVTRQRENGGDLPVDGIDVVTTDGRHVASVGAGKRWYLPSGHAWSPDGTRLLVAAPGRQMDDELMPLDVLVVDVATGAVTGRIPQAGTYVWRSPDRLAVFRIGEGAVETTLDGRVVRTLRPWGRVGEPIRVAVRPAS